MWMLLNKRPLQGKVHHSIELVSIVVVTASELSMVKILR